MSIDQRPGLRETLEGVLDGSAAWIAKTRRWAGRREGLGVVREEPHESAIVGSDMGTRNVCRMEIVDSHVLLLD